ncbi:MAG TPA: hypothetical protein VFW78_06935 [Bacteroidia bacterium]|nr:hypothetical protein [Bacteroidia bacterium]
MKLSGRIVRSEQLDTTPGITYHALDLSDLRKGMYLIKIHDQSGRMETIRIAVE